MIWWTLGRIPEDVSGPLEAQIMVNAQSKHKFLRNLWFDWSIPKCNQTITGTWIHPFLELTPEQETSSSAGSFASGFEGTYIHIWCKILSFRYEFLHKKQICNVGLHVHRICRSRPAFCTEFRSESNGQDLGPQRLDILIRNWAPKASTYRFSRPSVNLSSSWTLKVCCL